MGLVNSLGSRAGMLQDSCKVDFESLSPQGRKGPGIFREKKEGVGEIHKMKIMTKYWEKIEDRKANRGKEMRNYEG